MIKIRHWVIASVIALIMHVLTLVAVFASSVGEGVKSNREQGIEINLEMLGSLGDVGQITKTVTSESEPPPLLEAGTSHDKAIATAIKPQQVRSEPVPVKQPASYEVKKPLQIPEYKQSQKNAPVKEIASQKALAKKVKQVAFQSDVDTLSYSSSEQRLLAQVMQQKQVMGSGQANSKGDAGAEQSYVSLLAEKMARYKRYPAISKREREAGVVMLSFVINHTGQVSAVRIRESSGFKRLDDAVLQLLAKAQPFPSFDDGMKMSQLAVNIPIAFELKTNR